MTTTHTCTKHQPGKKACAVHCRCHCDACMDANRAYKRAWYDEHRPEQKPRRPRRAPSPRKNHHPVNLDDVAWLFDMGESMAQICAQTGWSLTAIDVQARRHQRPDISRAVGAEKRWQARAAA